MRQVQDKSYHLGILRYSIVVVIVIIVVVVVIVVVAVVIVVCNFSYIRSKIGELNNEIIKMSRDLEQLQQDSATYTTYEKRYCAGSYMTYMYMYMWYWQHDHLQ